MTEPRWTRIDLREGLRACQISWVSDANGIASGDVPEDMLPVILDRLIACPSQDAPPTDGYSVQLLASAEADLFRGYGSSLSSTDTEQRFLFDLDANDSPISSRSCGAARLVVSGAGNGKRGTLVLLGFTKEHV